MKRYLKNRSSFVLDIIQIHNIITNCETTVRLKDGNWISCFPSPTDPISQLVTDNRVKANHRPWASGGSQNDWLAWVSVHTPSTLLARNLQRTCLTWTALSHPISHQRGLLPQLMNQDTPLLLPKHVVGSFLVLSVLWTLTCAKPGVPVSTL